MRWAGNIAKNMTSNEKQFTVTYELLIAVAGDQSVQLKVAWCLWNLSALSKFAFVLLHNRHLVSDPLGNSELLPLNLNVLLGTSP